MDEISVPQGGSWKQGSSEADNRQDKELCIRMLKSSKNIRKISVMENVTLNQDLTKTRNQLSYEARKLVKAGEAKSSFGDITNTASTLNNQLNILHIRFLKCTFIYLL